MAIESVNNPALYGQLFEQQKDLIEAAVRKIVIDSSSALDPYFNFVPAVKNAKAFTFRRLIAPKVELTDLKPLQENVAPDPESISYGEYAATVNDYGASFEYTDKDVNYGFDNIVNNANTVIGNKLGYYKLILQLNALFATRGTITPEAKLIPTLDKAKNALIKSHAKPFGDGTFHCWLSIETLTALQAEIAAAGPAISEALKSKLDNGSEFVYHGWSFFTDYCVTQYFYHDGKSRLLFLANDPYGRKPATFYGSGSPEVYHNDLGNAGPLTTVSGKLVGDHLRQKGSLAGKLIANGAAVENDPTVLVCDFATTEVAPVLDIHNYQSYTGFRSTSSSPAPIVIKSENNVAAITAGTTLQLSTNVGTAVKPIWISGDEAIATVDANGKVTAKAAGNVEITVSYGGIVSAPFALVVNAKAGR